MHKFLAGFLGMAVIVVVQSGGCSDRGAVGVRYDLEKQFYNAEKVLRGSRIRPERSTPTPDTVLTAFGQVLENCYRALDSLGPGKYPEEYRNIEELTFKSASRLTQLYFRKDRPDTCVAITGRLINRVRLNGEPAATAYYNYGRALQAAGKWDSALTVYLGTLDRFYPPVFGKANLKIELFSLPLHLYHIVAQTGTSDEQQKRFEYAVDYYERILADFPGDLLGVPAHANLAHTYELHGDYRQAIAQLTQLTDTTGQIDPNAQLRIADIYAIGLKDTARALQEYNALQDRLTGADTVLIPTVMLKRALTQLNHGQFAEARSILVRLEDRYPAYYRNEPTAQLAKAETFEGENNWERAETEYEFLIEEYDGTSEAMSTYLYLANHFEKQGRELEAESWYQKAEERFDEIAERFAGTPREAAALSYKAELFNQRKNWRRAAEILSELFAKFPDTPVGRRAVLSAARLYSDKLDQRVTADSLIGELRAHLTEVDEEP